MDRAGVADAAGASWQGGSFRRAFSSVVRIGARRVGPGEPCFVIAEAGVNHNGKIGLGLELVDAAASAGADAVKFQTFRADRLAAPGARKAAYQARGTSSAEESQLEMLRQFELGEEEHVRLMARCRDRGIIFLSSPFDEESADMLERLCVRAFKIPSGELVNLPFLGHVGRKGCPILLSTGMATLADVEHAVEALESVGARDLVLLHCVSSYPAPAAEANLRAMETMRHAFRVPVGYSDHVVGNEAALAAVALGACVVEKHFTLDRHMSGPDHSSSLEPQQMAELIRAVRVVESALGNGRKRPSAAEAETARVARRSVVARRDLPAGTVLAEADLAAKRPGTGLPPIVLPLLIGRSTRRPIAKDALVRLEDLAG